jgi:glycine cleavage system aminomethyltransferase T
MAFASASLQRDYGDVRSEVIACRTRCALFDFSFLERAAIGGSSAQRVLEAFAGRSLAKLQIGQVCYALRIGSAGTLLADLTIWRTGAQTYELMSGRREDVSDLLRQSASDCRVVDLSAGTAVLAVQGPQSLDALRGIADLRAIAALPYFAFCEARLAGVRCVIGRLGYTGEPGFEIVVDAEHRAHLWNELTGRARPAGFAAADILRIEAGLVLFANEFVVPVTPSEAGLTRFFQGTDVLHPRPIRLVCFRAASDQNPCVWRPSPDLARPERADVIAVTSACDSVAAEGVLGLGYVTAENVSHEVPLRDPAGLFREIRLVSLPYYAAAKHRPRAAWPLAS